MGETGGGNPSPRLSFPPSLRVSLKAVPASLVVFALFATTARAHNPDTSYARFQVSRTSFEVKFTFDVTSLVRIVPTLDADRNRRLTRGELEAKSPEIVAFLRRTVAFKIDDAKTDFGEARPLAWPPDAGDAIAEKDYHAATSLISVSFAKPLAKPPADFWVRFHFFDVLGSLHTVLGAIAQDGKEDEVLFTETEPDYLYDTSYTSFAMPSSEPQAGVAAIASATPQASGVMILSTDDTVPQRRSSDRTLASRLWEFFVYGVEHILKGYDHILFLLSLIIVSRFRELVKIVTSFTVAHSITLALATLKVVELPTQWVEAGVAATIVYTALENFWIDDSAHRWKLTFVFGLIHGFGFAEVLRGLGLPTVGYVRSLAAFNIGVEAGQLAIVSALALPIAVLGRWKYGRRAKLAMSAVIALVGLGWFLDRAFDLGIMPFGW